MTRSPTSSSRVWLTGQGVRRQLERERGEAAVVDLDGPGLDLEPARVPVAEDRRHRRGRPERPVADDRHPLGRLARAVEVPLAVEVGRVAVGGRRRAAHLETGGVDPHPVEVDEGEVVAVLDLHQVGAVLVEPCGVAEAPEAVRVGPALGDGLVLVRDQRHPRAADRGQRPHRGDPRQDLSGRLLDHRAEVGQQQPALGRLPLSRPGDQHPVEARPVRPAGAFALLLPGLGQVAADRQHRPAPGVAGRVHLDRLVDDPVAEGVLEGRAGVGGVRAEEVLVVEQEEQVVGVGPVDGELEAVHVDRLDRHVALAARRQEAALALEVEARRQVAQGDLGLVGLLERRPVLGRQAGGQRQGVAPAGLEVAGQGERVALGRGAVPHLRRDPQVLARQARIDPRRELDLDRRLVEPRRAHHLAHLEPVPGAERDLLDRVLAQRGVADRRRQAAADHQLQGSRRLLLLDLAGPELDRRAGPVDVLQLDLDRLVLAGCRVDQLDERRELARIDRIVELEAPAERHPAAAQGRRDLVDRDLLQQEAVGLELEGGLPLEDLVLVQEPLRDQRHLVAAGDGEAAARLEAQDLLVAPAPDPGQRRLDRRRRQAQDLAGPALRHRPVEQDVDELAALPVQHHVEDRHRLGARVSPSSGRRRARSRREGLGEPQPADDHQSGRQRGDGPVLPVPGRFAQSHGRALPVPGGVVASARRLYPPDPAAPGRVTVVHVSTTITIRTDEALRRKLEERAAERGTSCSEVAREILENGLTPRTIGERRGPRPLPPPGAPRGRHPHGGLHEPPQPPHGLRRRDPPAPRRSPPTPRPLDAGPSRLQRLPDPRRRSPAPGPRPRMSHRSLLPYRR